MIHAWSFGGTLLVMCPQRGGWIEVPVLGFGVWRRNPGGMRAGIMLGPSKQLLQANYLGELGVFAKIRVLRGKGDAIFNATHRRKARAKGERGRLA